MIAKSIRYFFLLLACLPWSAWLISALFLGKEQAFQGMSQFCALFPGKFGTLFRAAFYYLSLETTSQRTSIAFLTTFSKPTACIGKHVSIGAQCNIGWAIIDDNCILASHICITSGKNQHIFEDIDVPIRLQGGTYAPVHIGKNCWIGAHSTIMADVGEGCIVGAGSVITKPIPPFSIVAGNPAKVLRSRVADENRTEEARI